MFSIRAVGLDSLTRFKICGCRVLSQCPPSVPRDHLGACKGQSLGRGTDQLSQKSWAWGSASCALRSPPGAAMCLSVRTSVVSSRLTGCPSASPVRMRRSMSQLHGPPWSGSSGRCPHLPSRCQHVSTGGSSSGCTAVGARLTASPGSRWCSDQLWHLCARTTSAPPIPGRLPRAVPQLHMVSGEFSGKGCNKWGGQGAGKGGWSHSPAPRTSERQGHSSEALTPAHTWV